MARSPVPTWFFALVVVRHEGRFLVVRERKHGQRWYLPAGRVEPGERLVDAAVRETLEESGVQVRLDGIIRIEHSARADGTARVRAVFTGHPDGDTTPKRTADRESLGAAWITLGDLDRLPLRSHEVRELFEHVERGGAIHPLDLLAPAE